MWNKSCYLLWMILLLLSCTREQSEQEVQNDTKELIITAEASDVTEWSAELKAYANPTPEMGSIAMGVLFSTETEPGLDNGTKRTSNELDVNNMFSISASNLSSETTYYYKAFVLYGGVYRYGKVKSFTTKAISASVSTEKPTGVASLQATMNGRLAIDTKENLSKSVWFLYGEKDLSTLDALKAKGIKKSVSLQEDNTFSQTLTSLKPGIYYYVACSKIYDKEFYGKVQSIVVNDFSATVKTEDATEISLFSATISGSLSISNADNLSKNVWFLYSPSGKSLSYLKSYGTKINSSIGTEGSFSKKLTGLTAGTEYYYVACAKVYDREIYGEVKSFTAEDIDASVMTGDVTNIGLFTATLSATLTVANSESLNKSVWFLYSSTASSLSSLKASGYRVTTSLSGDGSFNLKLSNLTYSTRYYYVACARVHDREVYGEVRSFTTTEIMATVTTKAASDIELFTAKLKGSLTVSNVEPLSKSTGFLYSPTASSITELMSSGTKVSSSLGNAENYECSLSGLIEGTTYYYAAYAMVNDKDFFGEVLSFTTKNFDLTCSTGNAEDIKVNTAVLHGALMTSGAETLSKNVGFIYSSEVSSLSSLISEGETISSTLDYNGSFSSVISNLSSNTKYYYVACGKVHNREVYGEIRTFMTDNFEIAVTTENASGIGLFSATLSGLYNTKNADNLSRDAWFLYSPTESTLSSLKKAGEKAFCSCINDMSFSVNIEDLKPSTTYYYVACVKVYDQYQYGEVNTFTTDELHIEIETKKASEVNLSSATMNGIISCNNPEWSSLSKNCYFLYGTSSSIDLIKKEGKKITCSLSNDGICKATASNLYIHSNTYYYVACVECLGITYYGEVMSFSKEDCSEYVDLGLSVKWCSKNLGARRVVDPGGHYSWGENYNYSTDNSYWLGKTDLPLNRDTANQYRSYLRIPSYAEFSELYSNCNISWISINGVNGYLFKSKKTGNSIFFPASGCEQSSGTVIEKGKNGYYWSSSWNDGVGNPWGLYFYQSNYYFTTFERNRLLSIRPVYDETL